MIRRAPCGAMMSIASREIPLRGGSTMKVPGFCPSVSECGKRIRDAGIGGAHEGTDTAACRAASEPGRGDGAGERGLQFARIRYNVEMERTLVGRHVLAELQRRDVGARVSERCQC